MQAIKDATQAARQLYGADISIQVARAPSFGHDDICILVRGKRHAEAAASFARVMRGARIEEQTSTVVMGHPGSAYSRITANRKAA